MSSVATPLQWSIFLEALMKEINYAEGEMDDEKIQNAYRAYFRIKDLCPYEHITGLCDDT